MSVTLPPPQPSSSKKGLGCLGCGCLVLALLAILLLALAGGAGYLAYSEAKSLTAASPADIPAFTGSDDVFENARQKMTAFDHDVKGHQAATLHLSADEINAVIAHTPAFIQNHVHIFVTIANNEARMQISAPTDNLAHGIIKGRYINADTTFALHFDAATKSIIFEPHTIKANDQTVMDANDPSAGPTSNASFNESFAHSFTPSFNRSFNQSLRQSPNSAAFLDQVKSMELVNGELVIETE